MVQQVVITLTDGGSSVGLYLDPNSSDPVPDGTTSQLYAPDLFHNYGITSFAVGVGSGVSNAELEEIASDPDEDYMMMIENCIKISICSASISFKFFLHLL